MRVDKKYSTFLFGVFMSLGMSFSMSLVLTLINLGGFYFEKWIFAFALGYAVSLPTSLAIIQVVRKTVEKLTTD